MSTYSQIYLHIIFAVKGRASIISPAWENDLYKFITGIVKNKGQKLLIINGSADHLHLLISLKPSCRISDLVREIKKSSNIYINDNFVPLRSFSWQEGYAVFSYNKSSINTVVSYIKKQKEHHKKITFKDEYKKFLIKFGIDYDERFLFDEIEN